MRTRVERSSNRRIPLHNHSDLNSGGKLEGWSAIRQGTGSTVVGDHPGVGAHDDLGLATDADLAAHAADTDLHGGGSLTVEDDEQNVTVSPATTLQFEADDFAVSDEGSGVAKVTFVGTAAGAITVGEDGDTPVANVDTVIFDGATVTDDGGGQVTVGIAASPGGSAVDPVEELFGTPDTAFEFDTTSLTGLTALGTATAENADTTIEGHLYIAKAATSSVALTGRHFTPPTAPYTVITKLTDHTNIGVNFERIGGLYIAESPPGVVEAIHVVHNNDWTVSHVRYTNPTTFNAIIGTDLTTKFSLLPVYYAVVVNSSSDVDFWYSFGGWVWKKRTDARNPSITVGVVGVCVDPENATHGVAGAYDYIRVWNSALTFPGI